MAVGSIPPGVDGMSITKLRMNVAAAVAAQ